MDTPVVRANMVELILRVAEILNERHIFVIVGIVVLHIIVAYKLMLLIHIGRRCVLQVSNGGPW